MTRSVGIIGYGAFGALTRELIERFAPAAEVRVYSSRYQPDGTTFFSLEETCAADVVILAVPIRAIEQTLVGALPLIPTHTAIVDISTVKEYPAKLFKKYASDRPYILTHPMFGPESYAKRDGDVSGFRIVIAEHTLPDGQYIAVKAGFTRLGFDVVEMTVEQHDRHLAETLFLTHFIGQTVARAKFERTEIDTVSFGFLMDAAESVKHDTELFKDVFKFNPYCKEVLDRFERAEHETRSLLEEPG